MSLHISSRCIADDIIGGVDPLMHALLTNTTLRGLSVRGELTAVFFMHAYTLVETAVGNDVQAIETVLAMNTTLRSLSLQGVDVRMCLVADSSIGCGRL